MKISSLLLPLLCATEVSSQYFQRASVFEVCTQIDATCNTDEETSAEIVVSSSDGNTLIYSNSPRGTIGFVNIADYENPTGLGELVMSGEPTSVAVWNDKVLVGVNDSTDYVNTAGRLIAVDIATQTIEKEWDLGGQPDAVAVSPDGAYVAIAIENERDEDLGDGAPPQAPAGYLVVVDTDASLDNWTTTVVPLLGLTGALYPTDPEPEFVAINENNICAVSLQENNALALVRLSDKTVTASWSAGTVDLDQIDLTEEGVILQVESETDIPREPDGITWIDNQYLATADEGDLDGGSRGFTIFDVDALSVAYTSGNDMEHMTAKFGHYPEERSGNKGNEPENCATGTFGGKKHLFVNSERSSLVFVYDVTDPTAPVYLQALPAGLAPEGAFTIPSRDLLVVASEKDDRGDKVRAVVNIYKYGFDSSNYPTIISDDRDDGTPIPFSALSGLAAETRSPPTAAPTSPPTRSPTRPPTSPPTAPPKAKKAKKTKAPKEPKSPKEPKTPKEPKERNAVFGKKGAKRQLRARSLQVSTDILYSVEDSFYKKSRVFKIDTSSTPAVITDEMRIMDSNDVLSSISPYGEFDASDLAALINDDKTVNLDLEGVAITSADDGLWVCTEGRGTIGDVDRPIESLNFLVKLSADAVIEEVITLPDEVNDIQLRFGFEGCAEGTGDMEGMVVVAFQRAWGSESNPRLGIYDIEAEDWSFLYYPLDTPTSQNGGWVGLSDIAPLGDGEFMVLERDNQGGPDAAIKKIYKIDISGNSPGDTVTKTLVKDLMPEVAKANGQMLEKIEGLAVAGDGSVWINNDNDGVDDNSGEQQLMNLGVL